MLALASLLVYLHFIGRINFRSKYFALVDKAVLAVVSDLFRFEMQGKALTHQALTFARFGWNRPDLYAVERSVVQADIGQFGEFINALNEFKSTYLVLLIDYLNYIASRWAWFNLPDFQLASFLGS
jgi:hypothetical protein